MRVSRAEYELRVEVCEKSDPDIFRKVDGSDLAFSFLDLKIIGARGQFWRERLLKKQEFCAMKTPARSKICSQHHH